MFRVSNKYKQFTLMFIEVYLQKDVKPFQTFKVRFTTADDVFIYFFLNVLFDSSFHVNILHNYSQTEVIVKTYPNGTCTYHYCGRWHFDFCLRVRIFARK